MRKKIWGIILALCLFLGCVPAGAAENGNTEGEVAASKLELLTALGVFNGKENTAGFLTRGRFIDYVVRLTDISGGLEAARFTDLAPSHEFYGEIQSAAAAGFVYGTGGEIHADDVITTQEAALITLRALGYGNMLKAGLSYTEAAVQAGILKGVAGQSELRFSTAAQLLWNAAHATYMEQTAFGKSQRYGGSGKTLLYAYREIAQAEGVLYGNETTYLTNAGNTPKGYVDIENQLYKTGETGADKLLGYSVKAYYREDEKGDSTLLYIEPKKTNSVLKVEAKNIDGYEDNRLRYLTEKGTEYARISVNADVIYNGAPVIPATKADFLIDTGVVTMIDRDGDQVYDAVISEEYVTYVVEGTTSIGSKILCKFGAGSLDMEDGKKTVFRDMNGNEMSPGELTEFDVLCIYESRNGEKKTAVYCMGEVEGKIESISGEADSVTIDGKEWPVSGFYRASGQKELTVGMEAVFYLDVQKEIAALNTKMEEKQHQYGWLIQAGTAGGVGNKTQLKLLDQDGTVKIMDVRSSLLLDGETLSGYTSINSTLCAEDFCPQLVIYKSNAGEEIYSIDTGSRGKFEGEDSLDKYYTGYSDDPEVQPAKLNYKSSSRIFGQKISMAADTRILVVPRDPSVAEDDDYHVYGQDYLTDDNDYAITAYKSVKAAHDAEIVLLYTEAGASGRLTDTTVTISVIDTVVQTIDGSGEEQYEIKYYQNGKYYSAETVRADVFDKQVDQAPWKPGRGDIIRLEFNEAGKIVFCELVYVRETDTLLISNPSSSNVNAVPRFQMANVYEKYGSNIWITRDELQAGQEFQFTWDKIESKAANKYNILLYDSEKNILKPGSVDDIVGYTNTGGSEWSRVFVHDRYGNPWTLVIYD